MQEDNDEYVEPLGGSSLEDAIPTADGGYLLGGWSNALMGNDKTQNSRGDGDFWVVKINSSGTKQWDKTFGGNDWEELTAMVPTADGGFLLGGFSWSGLSGDKSQASRGASDFWIVKINSNGDKVWDKRYGGSGGDQLAAMVPTPDGGFLLGGYSDSGISGDKSQANRGSSDFWIVKITSNGTKVWDKRFGGTERDYLNAIVPTADGGYLLGGVSWSELSGDKSQASRGDSDFWILKIDGNGTKIWDQRYGGIYNEDLNAIIATPDGGYLLGGSSWSGLSGDKTQAGPGFRDFWVVKINSTGVKTWDKTFGYCGLDEITSLLATPDGGYLLAGTSGEQTCEGYNEGDVVPTDYYVIKITGSGDQVWKKNYGGVYYDDLTKILPATNGGYLLAGSSDSYAGSGDRTAPNKGSYDYWLVKIKDDQPLTSIWNLRYGGSGSEGFTAAIKTTDGGYLAGGYSPSATGGDKSQSSRGGNDYWIVKTDALGAKQWDKRFGGPANEYLHTLLQTADGGYLLAGGSDSGTGGDKTQSSRGNRDFWVVKISSMGIKQWDKRFGGTGYDEAKELLQLSTGEYIVAGVSDSPAGGDKTQSSQGGRDYWVLKLSSTGTKMWDKRFGGTLTENLEALVKTADGGLVLGGTSASGLNGDRSQASQGSSDFWLVKIDANGTKLWDKRFGGSGADELYSLGQTSSSTGNLYIGGYSSSGVSGDKTQASQGGKDFWMLKLSSSGTKLWDKRFGGSGNEELRSMILTSDGGYLLAGHSTSGNSGDKSQSSRGSSDYWIVRTNSSGTKLWDKRFGGSAAEELRTVLSTTDGNFLMAGRSESGQGGDKTQSSRGAADYWLVKVSASGGVAAPTAQPARLAAVVIPAAGEQPEEEAIQPSATVKAYPNPFTQQVSVAFSLAQTQAVRVKVYNSQGQPVSTLFQGEVEAGKSYQVAWQPTTNLPTGIYILKLEPSRGKGYTQKVIFSH